MSTIVFMLEEQSFYCGDLDAVATAFDMPNIAQMKQKRLFRNPDGMENPKQELRKLTHHAYQPLIGSRMIAAHMRIHENRSHSFHQLLGGIDKLTGGNPTP